jgi:hypothetical protein
MLSELTFVDSRVIAEGAYKRLLLRRVGLHVVRERGLAGCPILAETAGKRVLRVCLEVFREGGLVGCPILAESAGKRLPPCVGLLVAREMGQVGCLILAESAEI